MHSYNGLWDDFIDEDNIKRCIVKAAVGKKKRRTVKKVIKDVDSYADEIRDYVLDFHNFDHESIEIEDGPSGKKREIIVPRFKEHVVHHMVVNSLMPMFTKGMYDHTYSSIPGRGLHKAAKKIRAWIDKDTKNVKYCLKMDIRKFFNSIDHDVLEKKLRKYLRDERVLNIVLTIIDATDHGIPLGFYTSHWLANWLLQPLDHKIVEKWGATHYVRYMDDMVIFGSNKAELHLIKDKIERWLNKHGLELKDNWQVFRFDHIVKNKKTKKKEHKGRALDFVGFVFYRDKTYLRKGLMLRLTRKAKKVQKKGKFTIHDARQLMAWFGWVDWADAYKMYTKYVAPNIQIKKCKQYISQYDKLQNKLEKSMLKEVA